MPGAEEQWLNVAHYEPADDKRIEHRPASERLRADKRLCRRKVPGEVDPRRRGKGPESLE